MMSQENRKERFTALVEEYQKSKAEGLLDLSSEETIRTWLNDMLGIFGWDVRDTSQVLQEKVLSKEEKEKLAEIGSTNTRPDYTLRIANQKITFLDAKDITVNLEKSQKSAFQIKSYGYSISAPCAFISNFEEFAIYDTGYEPSDEQPANFGRKYLKISEYVDNFELFDNHLLKENIYSGKLEELYKDAQVEGEEKKPLNIVFANFLSEFRVNLASEIISKNADQINNDSVLLNYIIQVIINRILFIRVCEARKLEEKELLKKFAADGFWTKFKESSYLDFYNHYDGPLFQRISSIHELEIDNEVFIPLVNYLYYPSPYRFDVIPTKLLSDIYEIFLSKKLSIADGVISADLKPEYLKSKGAAITPQYIVKDIIKRTLIRDNISNDGIKTLLSYKSIDISCGSGVFLIELFDYFEEILLKLYTDNPEEEYDHLFFKNDNETLLNIEGKRSIINNCIYGIDIDAEAVEVARMSLALKVIDNEDFPEFSTQLGLLGSQILNGIGLNIKCGNSLVDNSVLGLYPDIVNDNEELFKTKAFDWNAVDTFKSVFDEKGGFDFVVGNPPYVEILHFKNELPYMHKFINETYETSDGKLDLAIPFIERSLDKLNSTGRLGFIVQKRFFKTQYGSGIRNFIMDNKYLSSIIEFSSTSIFKGKLTYVASIFLDKNRKEDFHYHVTNSETETLPAYLRELPIAEVDQRQHITLPASVINHDEWAFDCFEIRNSLLEKGKLGDYVNLKGGPQALKNAAYHIRLDEIIGNIIHGHSQWAERVEIEIEACRPLMCNEQFYPFRPDITKTYVIFPYDIIDGEKREIPYDEYSERFPLAAEYLNSQRGRLEGDIASGGVQTMPMRFPDRYDNNFWHLYTRPNNLEHTYPKVFIPMTALDTFASVSNSDRTYADNANMWFVQIPDVNETKLYAVAAVINSTLFSVLARSIANPQDAGYYKFNKQFLAPVPFPKEHFLSNNQLMHQLSEVAQSISSRQSQYINESEANRTVLRPVLEQIWNQLDDLVYELYELNEEEIEFFNHRGRNISRVEFFNQWA
jgi:hypothetical protein